MEMGTHKTIPTVPVTVLMSGGIDSTACAHLLLKQGFAVEGLYFDYGHAANRVEARTVKGIAKYLNIPVKKEKVLTGHSFGPGEIVGRNAFFIFCALMTLPPRNGILALGIHGNLPYYDCSPGFLEKMNIMVREYTGGQMGIIAPFLTWNKGQIILYCVENDIPLDMTYSCERGQLPPCGRCPSCKDRGEY